MTRRERSIFREFVLQLKLKVKLKSELVTILKMLQVSLILPSPSLVVGINTICGVLVRRTSPIWPVSEHFTKPGWTTLADKLSFLWGNSFQLQNLTCQRSVCKPVTESKGERGRGDDILFISFFLCRQAIAYFVHVMETVVHKDYVLVYFHTLSESDNQPDSNFFKQLYSMVDDRYLDLTQCC